jgi:hypothetical protein
LHRANESRCECADRTDISISRDRDQRQRRSDEERQRDVLLERDKEIEKSLQVS